MGLPQVPRLLGLCHPLDQHHRLHLPARFCPSLALTLTDMTLTPTLTLMGVFRTLGTVMGTVYGYLILKAVLPCFALNDQQHLNCNRNLGLGTDISPR